MLGYPCTPEALGEGWREGGVIGDLRYPKSKQKKNSMDSSNSKTRKSVEKINFGHGLRLLWVPMTWKIDLGVPGKKI